MKSRAKHVSCLLLLCLSCFDTPYLSLLLPCLFLHRTKRVNVQEVNLSMCLFYYALIHEDVRGERRIDFSPLYYGPRCNWVVHLPLYHSGKGLQYKRQVAGWTPTAEIEAVLPQGVEPHFFANPGCSLVIIPTEPLCINNFFSSASPE
jgi:hypothetical protein